MRMLLAQTAYWLHSLDRITHGFDTADPRCEDIGTYLDTVPSGFGVLAALCHAGQFFDTPLHWTLPSVSPGTCPAWW